MQKKYYYLPEKVYAGKGKRLANFVIDRIVIYILTFLLGMLAYILSEALGMGGFLRFVENMTAVEELLFGVVVSLIYYMALESTTGRTIGKFVTNTRVINESEKKAGPDEVFIRSLCRFIPFDAFSFLGSEGRGWHDSIPKTYVVDIKKYDEEKQIREGLDQLGANTQEI
ncbi:RDD family protein [Sinomicrobium sp. M5D2P17]